MDQVNLYLLSLLLLQCFSLSFVLLFLFRMRAKLGIGALFAALGFLQFAQGFLASSIYYEILPNIVISPGSSVLFVGSLFAVLLIYLREDATEVRNVVYALVVVNVMVVVTYYFLFFSSKLDTGANLFQLPKGAFSVSAWVRLKLVGTILLFLDALLIIILYERISRITRDLFFRILLTMLLVLAFDSICFAVGTFGGSPDLKSMLLSGLVSKSISGIVFSMICTFYLNFFERGQHRNTKLGDVFHFLTYRQKYELIQKEQEIVQLEAEAKQQELKRINELVLKTTLDGYLLANSLGEFVDVNEAYCKMSGYNREELLAMEIRDVGNPG